MNSNLPINPTASEMMLQLAKLVGLSKCLKVENCYLLGSGPKQYRPMFRIWTRCIKSARVLASVLSTNG